MFTPMEEQMHQPPVHWDAIALLFGSLQVVSRLHAVQNSVQHDPQYDAPHDGKRPGGEFQGDPHGEPTAGRVLIVRGRNSASFSICCARRPFTAARRREAKAMRS
jgi:hypothetical protein